MSRYSDSLLLTHSEAADLIGVSNPTIGRMLRDGRLEGVRISDSRIRPTRASVLALGRATEQDAAPVSSASVMSFDDVNDLADAFATAKPPTYDDVEGKYVLLPYEDVIAVAQSLHVYFELAAGRGDKVP